MPDDKGGLMQCITPDPSCMRSVWNDRNAARELVCELPARRALQADVHAGARVRATVAVAPNAETELRPSQEDTFTELMLPRARRHVYPYAEL